MAMLSFFKPKWQHKNPKVRQHALQTEALAESIILSMAQSDPSCDVRMYAFTKIEGIVELYTLFLQEPNAQAQSVLLKEICRRFTLANGAEGIHHFMTHTVRRDFPVARLLMACEDVSLKPALMQYVIAKEEATHLIEQNYALSVDEIEAMDDIATLKQFLQQNLGKDKQRTIALKNRIQTLETAQMRAVKQAELLRDYQALAESEPLAALNQLSDLDAAWQALSLGDAHQAFRNAYLARHQAMNEQRRTQLNAWKQIAAESMECDDVDHLKQSIKQLDALMKDDVFSLKERTEMQQLQVNLHNKITQLNELNNKAAIVSEPVMKAQPDVQKVAEVTLDWTYMDNALVALEQLMASGELQAAAHLEESLLEKLQTASSSRRAEQYRAELKSLTEPMHAQLDVVRWRTHQALSALCDVAEGLINSEASDLGARLKALRMQWQTAQVGIDHVPRGLHQRFEKACHQIHQNVMKMREKDQAARAIYRTEAEGLLSALQTWIDGIDWQAPNWDQLMTMRQQFFKEWHRYLNQYSTDGVLSYGAPLFLHRDKQQLEKQMRAIIAPLEQAIDAERAAEKARREVMITELNALLSQGDIVKAVAQAKAFNRDFAPTVRATNQEENHLWKMMRLVNDQIFAARDAQMSTQTREAQRNVAKKREILARLETLSTAHELDQVKAEWQKVGRVPKAEHSSLERAFKSAIAAIEQAQKTRMADLHAQKRAELLKTAEMIGALETAALSGLPFEIEPVRNVQHPMLKKRVQTLLSILAGQRTAQLRLEALSTERDQVALRLVLLREIMLEIPARAEEREARLALQMAVLSQALNQDRTLKDTHKQLERLDDEWLSLVVGEVNADLYDRFR
ncbi:DUF349 domain-containing protein [Wohlfahrtiimonas chitiniclastica]|uniref:DUF349 domain-containing protein n=1 Tax=Wohlfahrtiimonas chitiniclastica TaxID=400946 RepID=UPI000B98CAE8|nr:DUF349 domain-containing protein [Wohlfahrtiimonas chitiniclastica]OYQ76398.1 hypothetical protein B9T18_03285 [Wohlfahrtiimonas chitiniclastica]